MGNSFPGRVVLNKSHYVAGEAVEGQLELNLKSDLVNCRKLTINLRGKEFVQWTEKIGNTYVTYWGSTTFFQLSHDLRHAFLPPGSQQNPDYGINIPAGQYLLPFRVVLPTNATLALPKSCKDHGFMWGQKNQVEYSAYAHIECGSGNQHKCHTSKMADFQFSTLDLAYRPTNALPEGAAAPRYDANGNAVLPQMGVSSTNEDKQAVKCCCCCKTGEGDLQVTWFPQEHNSNYAIPCQSGDLALAQKYPQFADKKKELLDVLHLRVYIDAPQNLKYLSVALHKSATMVAGVNATGRFHNIAEKRMRQQEVRKYSKKDPTMSNRRCIDVSLPVYKQDKFVAEKIGHNIRIEYSIVVRANYGSFYNSHRAVIPVRVADHTNVEAVDVVPNKDGKSLLLVRQYQAGATAEALPAAEQQNFPAALPCTPLILSKDFSRDEQRAMGGDVWQPQPLAYTQIDMNEAQDIDTMKGEDAGRVDAEQNQRLLDLMAGFTTAPQAESQQDGVTQVVAVPVAGGREESDIVGNHLLYKTLYKRATNEQLALGRDLLLVRGCKDFTEIQAKWEGAQRVQMAETKK